MARCLLSNLPALRLEDLALDINIDIGGGALLELDRRPVAPERRNRVQEGIDGVPVRVVERLHTERRTEGRVTEGLLVQVQRSEVALEVFIRLINLQIVGRHDYLPRVDRGVDRAAVAAAARIDQPDAVVLRAACEEDVGGVVCV